MKNSIVSMTPPLQGMRISLCVLALYTGVAVQAQAETVPAIKNFALVPWLTIQSEVGYTNQIQYTNKLTQNNWAVLTNLVVTQSPYWFFDVTATSAPQRFYRVVGGPNLAQVNQPPTLNPIADVNINEDAGQQTVNLSGISSGAAGESQTLTVTASSSNTGLIPSLIVTYASPDPTGTLKFTPVANAIGSALISVVVRDSGGRANGGLDGVTNTFTITVSAVNDAPSFVKGAEQTVNEDSGPISVPGWATAISAGPANESSQTVSFTVGNNNTSLFSAQPAVAANGTLTYTPAPNANGAATVTVTLKDSGGTANGGVDTSAGQTSLITVNAVNDAPSFVKGADQTVNENSGPVSVPGWATAMSAGPANESSQTVSFVVANNNTSLFSAQPAVAPNGTLTYTPSANTSGMATVTVTLKDSGGTANGGVDTSAAQTFVITVIKPASMAVITNGVFRMGEPGATTGNSIEHEVLVDAFLMDSNLVSYTLWTNVYRWAMNSGKGYSFGHAGAGKANNHPVQTVDWYDVVKWCNARSEKEGLVPCYYTSTSRSTNDVYRAGTNNLGNDYVNWDANGYRLATEAEWERAARGGTNGRYFPWGTDKISKITTSTTKNLANYFGNTYSYTYDEGPNGYHESYDNGSEPYTSPVGDLRGGRNGYGLNDMAGNVSEWCWDWYYRYYYTTNNNPVNNPHGPNTGSERVVRGGSWQALAPAQKCSTRDNRLPKSALNTIGFRCVRRLE